MPKSPPKPAGPVRVAIYTRVSTEDQAKEGFSLGAQLERLRAYCQAREWTIAAEYVDDGHSGRSTHRPAYQRMMTERDRWDTLLVAKMDRIHRNSKNFMAMMEELASGSKEFASMTESLDTSTAMGRFVMDIIQRIAQLESEQIGERVYVGMRQKAKDGKGAMGSPSPFGYRYRDGRLELAETEVPVVRRIFEAYIGGCSLPRLVQELSQDGLRTRAGAAWSPSTLSRMLRNPLYAGVLRWDDVERPRTHPPVVSELEFRAVQTRLRGRGGRPRTKPLVDLAAAT